MQLPDGDYAAYVGKDLVREDNPDDVASQIVSHLNMRQTLHQNRLNQLQALSSEVAAGMDQKTGPNPPPPPKGKAPSPPPPKVAGKGGFL
jgi:hypothetical protein